MLFRLSLLSLTTLAGAAQGLAVILALPQLLGAGLDNAFVARSLWVAVALAIVSLVASFFHLGRPLRGEAPVRARRAGVERPARQLRHVGEARDGAEGEASDPAAGSRISRRAHQNGARTSHTQYGVPR